MRNSLQKEPTMNLKIDFTILGNTRVSRDIYYSFNLVLLMIIPVIIGTSSYAKESDLGLVEDIKAFDRYNSLSVIDYLSPVSKSTAGTQVMLSSPVVRGGLVFEGTDYEDLGGRVTNNYQAWDPNPAVDDWVPGNYSHISEGEVVPFSVEITIGPDDVNKNFEFTACFDYDQAGSGPGMGPYAYIDLKDYNTSFSPDLRGSAINSTVDGVSIDGDGTILNVYPLAQGVGADPGAPVTGDDQLCYEIELMAPSTAGTYYIYFGAELAKAGATTEYGDIVGVGEGLSSWPFGTFQSKLVQVTGNKTVNAQPGDIQVVIEIVKLVDTDGDGTVDLTGGVDSDPLLAGYSIVVCDDGTGLGDLSCETLVTDNTGKVSFQRFPGDYDVFETSLPSGYEFVTWGDGITNEPDPNLNNQGNLTVGETTFTGSVTNTLSCVLPDINNPGPQEACDELANLPDITGTNLTSNVGYYDDSQANGGQPLTLPITSTMTVWIYDQFAAVPGCNDEESFDVTIEDQVQADELGDATECDSYTLPALTNGVYYTGPGGTGTMLNAGDEITTTQTIYIYVAATATCPEDESSFDVTIEDQVQADELGDATECDSYTLPALTNGVYYTGPGGTGTMLNAGDEITTTQTIYIYVAATATCPEDESSFDVTIEDQVQADELGDATECDSYTLPALTNGVYYTGPGGTGTMLNAGDEITTTQTIYIYVAEIVCVVVISSPAFSIVPVPPGPV